MTSPFKALNGGSYQLAPSRGCTWKCTHHALTQVTDLVLRSYGDELSVPALPKGAIFAIPQGRTQGSPVDGFGIHRFEYRANDEGPPRHDLAVACATKCLGRVTLYFGVCLS